jgi:hypothetical protein
MVLKTLQIHSAARGTLRDFTIEGAAEIGACLGTQSFRATRHADGRPVLLHKIRPAASLVDLRPIFAEQEPPDFTKPFVTQFTGLFVVAGSAYLVEPLPPCFTLADVWRRVLQKRPDQAFAVIALAVSQVLSLVRRLLRRRENHGALNVGNIVLAPAACFGLLAAHLPCREGRLWLRKDPQSPVKPDFCAFADIVGALLDIEARTAALQNVSTLLPEAVRHSIQEMLYAVEQTTIHAGAYKS